MMTIDFSDKTSYNKFIHDVASSLANILLKLDNDPEIITQRRAYSIFGRANVDRWKKEGKIHPMKRPGKIEYRTSELRYVQKCSQDYL